MIKKYRKKPVVIEAWEFKNDAKDFPQEWKNAQFGIGLSDDVEGILIPTLGGAMVCSLGDYIIKGIQGEFYPCKPDIFKQTHELVD